MYAPFDPWRYAEHLKVVVLDFHKLGLSPAALRQLTAVDGDSWSAMTIKQDELIGVVLNPSHADTRQRADLMHELAHIELEHVPMRVEVSKTGLMLLSDYSEEQEQEADWHAAAYLLPRDGIFRLRSRNKSAADIGQHFGVSKALCEWRLRMTGVEVQLRRTSSF
ncbi:MAG TPA: ImmA/IrrE family metallo-endopeptidase [Pseudolabrys sp.]|uniref:ImmA/IrrE family metallo-endopeptidase n=1 Tax=Pseudolabrys sp. TaxID=1960880 RepID=UPI002DDD7087|nr:ImmA/IrrE family metallo-endopeptidase [Pseudolabrys sp.]HEV2628537.1 ImmA/IrrE family metallo-endopeptidase [Pseudolabrys sp.]